MYIKCQSCIYKDECDKKDKAELYGCKECENGWEKPDTD